MAGQCSVPKPKSLKDLLELFSKLHQDQNAVKSLQIGLEEAPGVTGALSAGKATLKALLNDIHAFHDALVNNSGENKYEGVIFSNDCDDKLLTLVLRCLAKLFWPLQLLSLHVNGKFDMYGLNDWQAQKTKGNNNELGMWLTGTENGVEGAGQNDKEESLISGLELIKRGFQVSDLKDVQGGGMADRSLNTKLSFVDGTFTHLMKGLFLNKPWQPGKVGDMCAFLEGFCSVMNNDTEFKKEFVKAVKENSGVHSEDFTKKLPDVKTDLGGFEGKLTPINKTIYHGISQKHVTVYLGFLMYGIPELKRGLTVMKTAVEKWTEEDVEEKKEEEEEEEEEEEDGDEAKANAMSSRYAVQTMNCFDFGFQRVAEGYNKAEIKATLDKLTGNNGSLDLLVDLLNSANMADESTDTGSGIAGGLLGTTALLGGGGGGAYALNLFGFGDFMRNLFRGPSVTNLRG